MNQKETSRNIKDVNSLSTVVMNLAEKSDLTSISKLSDSVITSTEKRKLGNRTIIFICTLSELNGKVPLILDEIINKSTESDEIIIVTSNKKKISEYFIKWIKKEVSRPNFEFWDEADLIDKIDNLLPEYWGHNDLFLKSYEDSFIKGIEAESELKKVLKLDSKFEDLLNVFIEPKIYYYKEDSHSERKVRIKINVDFYLKYKNFIISGDAGTGKSTLLKEIARKAISHNKLNGSKTLPIIIRPSSLVSNNFSIEDAINEVLVKEFGEDDIVKVFADYHVLLLIDSIDEMEKSIQQEILSELGEIVGERNVNFIICTRNYENLTKDCEICDHTHTFLSNFDQNQVKLYLDNFFKFDLAKSQQLWDSLLDNKILERIPTTPLTISLMSILYEENGYEVPATLTDVYDNFNLFLLGRLNVKSQFEFLEINVKEKILSMYALQIIRTPNRIRKTKEEFIEYIIDFFIKKSITIEEKIIPELLFNLTEGTGILYVDDKELVSFKHDHFMEYYASREIFNQHNRQELESELLENFTVFNWQNTAIFYSGRTKDMPEFLQGIIDRTKKYTQLNDFLLSVSGLGYILQSLWMTDSQIRKNGVIAALELLIKADSKVKELADSKFHFFKGIRDIDIALMNLVWFYKHFNSVTIKDPLNLAYEDLASELKKLNHTNFEKDLVTRQYQMFCIASTLNTGRNEDDRRLNQLFDEDKILNNPFFVLLFDNAIRILESSNEKKLKDENKLKSKIKKYTSIVRFYLDTPAEDLRFTNYEQLSQIKSVELFTEGKTDASIITQAFKILTQNKESFWNITSMDKITSKGGGANELAKHLIFLSRNISSDSDNSKTIIGIFDNDAKGFQEFNGLNEDFILINGIVKKHKIQNIYAILLPIPEGKNYEMYHQKEQVFKFFAIEHYFELELLKKEKLVEESPIKGVYKITGDKTGFSEKVLNIKDAKEFINFPVLFREIDSICKKEENYID